MTKVDHQTSPPNAMSSSCNFASKHHQNVSHLDGLYQTKELTLVRHIEALKCAANAPLLFPNLGNSSRQNTSLLSIANSGERTDTSTLRNSSRPKSSSWVVDPASVPGNLRKQANEDERETALTIEEIISRGSSVSENTIEKGENAQVVKSRVRARRKSNKSLTRKVEAASQHYDSNFARSSSIPANQKPSRCPLYPSKNIDSGNLDTLTALCKGITIQEKVPNNINMKISPYSRKSSANTGAQQSSGKITVTSITRGSGPNTKALSLSEHLQFSRKKVTSNKCEEKKTVKVFQSEQQSGSISDLGLAVPCAPPATPTPEQLRRFEYVPSLQDVRAQRAFRQRLQVMEAKACQKEMRKKENLASVEKLSLKEKKQQLKKFQRQQVYALNKVMTELEHQRFQTFMQGLGTG